MTEPGHPPETPYDLLGGEESVRKLAECFYEQMALYEPELLHLHRTDQTGRVTPELRERFALFLVEWLGGPRLYSPVHGHPRLRMRHARVRIGIEMRDAWLRAMQRALDEQRIDGDVRAFLDVRFSEVADFLRNADG